jgi:hypothetical protein
MPPTPDCEPEAIFRLGEVLLGKRDEAACVRAGIGRVYYAAFLLGLIRARGYQRRYNGDDHGGLVRHLRRGKTRALGDKLDALRKLREHADYHLRSTAGDGCHLCQAGIVELTDDKIEEVKAVAESCFNLMQRL